ncbi:MAG: threonine synthase [Solobacterium sp.]|nr:threonine synthase [Solobacterium sp.]
MNIISTRDELTTTASKAIIYGLAEDGGLYTPIIEKKSILQESWLNLSYQELAIEILSLILDDYTKEELSYCVSKAYDTKWDNHKIVPITKYSKGYIAELWHGPTSAFKDIALTLLPTLLTTAFHKQDEVKDVAILTATSGDTGKAALAGFQDIEHTSITVFYPQDGVSTIQKRQMQTSQGANVEVIAIEGNFDDCQRIVKEANANKAVQDACKTLRLSSANSINLGRLAPQIVYYFSSYLDLIRKNEIQFGEEVNFSVPTGNFGNILAGYLAKQLGLPIHKFICASNSNHILTDFFTTGIYSLDRDFLCTMSPSMDILVSSNLERLLYLLFGAKVTKKCMLDLQEKKSYSLTNEQLDLLQKDFYASWTSEEECQKTIRDLFEQEHICIDPHTSVALHAAKVYQEKTKDTRKTIVLSTASPYKFAQDVYYSLTEEKIEDGFEAMQLLNKLTQLSIPKPLAALNNLPIRFTKTIHKEEAMETIIHRLEDLQK